MEDIRFSVIIALYNKSNAIRNTIKSVLAQTYAYFEVIIVNDGSTDGSNEIVKEFTDQRIRLIDKSNGGVSSARNMAIKNAQNEWLAILDADDMWEPNHLEVFKRLITEYPNNKFFATNYTRASGRVVWHDSQTKPFIIDDEQYLQYAITPPRVLPCNSDIVCIHRSCFDVIGFYDERCSNNEDYDIWIKLVEKFRLVKTWESTAIVNDTDQVSHLGREENKKFNIKKNFPYYLQFSSLNKPTIRDEYYFYLMGSALISRIFNLDIINAFRFLCRYNYRYFYIPKRIKTAMNIKGNIVYAFKKICKIS